MLDGGIRSEDVKVALAVLRRWWPLLAVAALLAAAGAAASTTQLPLSRVTLGGQVGEPVELDQETQPTPTLSPGPPRPPRPPSDFEIPPWVSAVLIGIAAIVVLTVLAFFIGAGLRSGSRFRRRTVRKKEPASKVDIAADLDAEVVAALDAGLLELDEADTDPRRTVIACWVRLETAAAAAGTPRLPGDTSTDLVLRLLEGHRLSASVLTGFADVYRLARYAARHEVDEHMREQAKTSLSRLRGELIGVPL